MSQLDFSLSQPSLKKRRLVKNVPAKAKKTRRWPINGTVGKPRPFPIRMVATMRYCSTVSATSAVSSIANFNFSCNSIYDPDVSSTGHQPYGHDQYAAIYTQYTVLKSRIKVIPTLAVASTALTYGVGIEPGTTGLPSLDTWAEKPSYKVQGNNQAYAMLGNKPLLCYWDRKKRFPHQDIYRTVSSSFNANPSEIEIYNVVIQKTDGTALGTVYLWVEIEYWVEMYEPKDLGSS